MIVVGGLVCALVTGLGQPAFATSNQTRTNLATALHDEASAYAEYQAWSHQADAEGNGSAATLLRATADQERGEHFAQLAAAYRLVGMDASNVRTAIVDERSEAVSTYPAFADQAAAQGDTMASELFDELASDECSHRVALSQALRALTIGGRWPDLPAFDPVAIVPGPARSVGATLVNLRTAMRGEAFASARYLAFAQGAYRHGHGLLGGLLLRLSAVELYEHFAQLATLAGLVGTTTTNLGAAIAAEGSAIASYGTWSTAATAAGDGVEAALFTDIRSDEIGHQTAFATALGG